MKRMMVTGLALGQSLDLCQACNLDLSWMCRFPSVLLWAEEILVPSVIWDIVRDDTIPKGASSEPKGFEFARAVKVVCEMAHSAGILRVFDPHLLAVAESRHAIVEQVERDIQLIIAAFPGAAREGDTKVVPGRLFLEGHEFCSPYLYTLYLSLLLSRQLDATCLYDSRAYTYMNYKFGLSVLPQRAQEQTTLAFSRIFGARIPNPPILPEFVLESPERCRSCAKSSQCSESYLADTERRVATILKWRDYDEIHQLRGVLRRIARKHQDAGFVEADEIVREFEETERKTQRRLNRVFPKVHRWANLTMAVSVAAAILGEPAGIRSLTALGAGGIGVATIMNEVREYLTSKYKWIGLHQSEPERLG